jgi:hypothetical protein
MDVMKLETLIAYLADKITIKGKKALQKLVYFCAEAGVPIYANFRLHIYGPYSNEVAEELGEAVTSEIVKVSPDGYSFSKGSSCAKYFARDREDIEVNREKIQRVLDVFGGFTPLELELYATIHFIATALSEAYGEVTEERVVKEVYRAKGNKFNVQRIKSAYQDLSAWNWIT